jgi:hypothetical protein
LVLQETNLFDCECVSESLLGMTSDDDISSPMHFLPNSTATLGQCPQGCNTLGLWLLLIGVVVFLIFVLRIPTLLITIRYVVAGVKGQDTHP